MYCCILLTGNETESLAANATISAQETVPGQACSSASFTMSITSNPASDRLGGASFSAVLSDVEFSSSEASQPYIHARSKQSSYKEIKCHGSTSTTYPNEAVMKEHSQQFGRQYGVLLRFLIYYGLHDLLGVGTTAPVEVWLEACRRATGSASTESQRRGQQDEAEEEEAGLHLLTLVSVLAVLSSCLPHPLRLQLPFIERGVGEHQPPQN